MNSAKITVSFAFSIATLIMIYSNCAENNAVAPESRTVDEEMIVETDLPQTDGILLIYADHYRLGGDIVLIPENETHTNLIEAYSEKGMSTRGVSIATVTKWPNNTVNYKLKGFKNAEKTVIRAAMDSIQRYCKARFVESTAKKNDYVYVISKVTKQSYGGLSTLGYGKTSYCKLNNTITWGVTVHEFCHGLGMHHEHQRYDRDSYITITLSNVSKQYQYAFDKLSQYYNVWDSVKKQYVSTLYCQIFTTYDYQSIMHYGAYAFSKNGKATITAGATIGQYTYLSAKDKATLSSMY